MRERQVGDGKCERKITRSDVFGAREGQGVAVAAMKAAPERKKAKAIRSGVDGQFNGRFVRARAGCRVELFFFLISGREFAKPFTQQGRPDIPKVVIHAVSKACFFEMFDHCVQDRVYGAAIAEVADAD